MEVGLLGVSGQNVQQNVGRGLRDVPDHVATLPPSMEGHRVVM